jgi:hypothetical protein
MRRIAIGAVLLLAGVRAAAQQPEYRVEVRLVEVEARVTDSSGLSLVTRPFSARVCSACDAEGWNWKLTPEN